MAEDEDKNEDPQKGGFPIGFPDLSPAGRGFKKFGSVIGSTAKSVGVNTITQNIIRGYFTTKLSQLRPDQLHTLLESGVFISDLIEEDSPPEPVRTPMNLILTFMSKEQVISALNSLVTPQLVARMLEEVAPDVHKKVMEHPGSGYKWYADQTEALKGKLRRMIWRW